MPTFPKKSTQCFADGGSVFDRAKAKFLDFAAPRGEGRPTRSEELDAKTAPAKAAPAAAKPEKSGGLLGDAVDKVKARPRDVPGYSCGGKVGKH